jgi:hypothetical protein
MDGRGACDGARPGDAQRPAGLRRAMRKFNESIVGEVATLDQPQIQLGTLRKILLQGLVQK